MSQDAISKIVLKNTLSTTVGFLAALNVKLVLNFKVAKKRWVLLHGILSGKI